MKSNHSVRLLLAGALLIAAVPAFAANPRTVLYLDGARIEQAVTVRKGGAVVMLPPAVVAGSLRVEPVAGTVIDRVDIGAPPAVKNQQRDQRELLLRRDNLEDRLAALAVKEEIFKAAAKAQSGKAPKRSKTNPDPLATIRQGTDYAVAQLEAVYRSRRSAERELAVVNKRLAALAGDPAAVGSVARITTRGGDQLRVSYLVRDRKWVPRYDLRFQRPGTADLTLLADAGAGSVVPALISSAGVAREMPVAASGVVTTLLCGVNREELRSPGQPVVHGELACAPAVDLPGGSASCYYRGSFLGEIQLGNVVAGKSLTVECGTFKGIADPVQESTVK